MHRNVVLRPSAVVACSIAILCCSVVARAQSVDSGFDPGANQTVNTIAVQPDGKTVVGGNFTGLGGVSGTTVRHHIGRLNVDGTVDPGFNPGTNAPVRAVAVQPDGKTLIGGNFTSVGGGDGLLMTRNRIARLNADGTVDAGFNPGANLNVYALAVQPDGKILVGGNFSTLGGATRIGIGRLNANGSIDTAFNPGASKLPSPGAPPEIYAIVVQPDGKILLGGYFNGLGGGTGATSRNFIGRLNADAGGTVDTGFNPGVTSISGVNALALQTDGKIVVGGTYTQLGGSNRANIGRIDANGALDLAFNPGAETQVLTLAVQTDGKILAGGLFKWLGGAGVPGPLMLVRNYIGRLDTDGVVDATFDPGANNAVNAVAVQGDGAIVAGGIFDHLGNGASLVAGAGTLRNRIGRITNTAAVQTLTLSGGNSVVTWSRSGSGPEVSRVTFESSITGVIYTLLGSGTRVAGGWQFSGLSLPTNVRAIRARGYYGTGQNGSGSIVQSILTLGPPLNQDGDFDGDGKADLTVYRPSSGTWFTLQSGTSTLSAISWGSSIDLPVHGDYDGDGRADLAVYRPSTGTWFILASTAGYTSTSWGISTDVPVPADYDGDGKTDIAVFRPSTGTWFILQSATSAFVALNWGTSSDVPVPGDYDGDGRADVAVYRPSTGTWFVLASTAGYSSTSWGIGTDVPVPADYDGDGKTDIAVFRPSTGTWFISRSTSGLLAIAWGIDTDVPVPVDYDGDGKTDIAVYRPSTGTWYIFQSGNLTVLIVSWGTSTDIPIFKRP